MTNIDIDIDIDIEEPTHLQILKQGVERWNMWRQINHEIKPNLRRVDLNRAYLFGASLSEANLIEANLSDADLGFANLIEATLVGANLYGATLIGADLRRANLFGADLAFAGLSGAGFSQVDLSGADLEGAKNLTWKQVSTAFIDDETKLPPEIEDQHKDELKAMREKTRKEREGN